MSRHWNPDADIAGACPLESLAPAKKHWPAGATAGLVVVAIGCVGLAALLYKLAGPRDVFPG